jgi:formylmethanofuran dehydrogenase subunit C
MPAEAQRVVAIPDSRLSVSKRFGRYKDEDEKAVRRIVGAKENPAIEGMKGVWRAYAARDLMTPYEIALEMTRPLAYSAEDVTRFCIALAEFQDVKQFHEIAGSFLSALIANSPEDSFVLPVGQFVRRIDNLGFHNTKNLTIIGDTGHYAGAGMEKGSILIKGDGHRQVGGGMTGGSIIIENDASSVGDGMQGGEIEVKGSPGEAGKDMKGGLVRIGGDCYRCGERLTGGSIIVSGYANDVGEAMEGGNIRVNGDCRGSAGQYMRGGLIVIEGDACIGDWMMRGEIRVEGDIRRIGNDPGGKIYHKGKLVVDK